MRGTADCLLLVVALVLMSGSPGYAGENEAPAPRFAAGDTWKYKNSYGKYTESVAELREDGTVFHRSYEPNARFLVDGDLAVRKIEGKLRRDVSNYLTWQYIKFPAGPGLTFTYKVEFLGKWAFEIEVKAAAWEEIEVPAGKFRALRMESCWTNTTSGWYGCGMKHWYAPEAKTFIKRQTPGDWDKGLQKMDFELDSFAPGTK
jgi:hypothetical protein